MARRVIKKDKHPFEMKSSSDSQWVCMCGLSKTQPICDKSHKKTLDEDDSKVYEYDTDLYRKEVKDTCEGCSGCCQDK